MSKIQATILKGALAVFVSAITSVLLPIEVNRRLSELKANGTRGEEIPDRAKIEGDVHEHIDFLVGKRLTGAIASYEREKQLECLRYMLLALQAIFNILNFHKAANYLSEKNKELQRIK